MKEKKIGQIFSCSVCGNEVIVTKIGGGELKCCDRSMQTFQEDSTEIIDEEDEESEE